MIFETDDISLFAKASHDNNPLHCSYGYARKTPYGEQVVHGILGVFACLEKLAEENKSILLSQMKVKFWKPIFCGIPYTIVKTGDKSIAKMVMFDGETVLLDVKVKFSDSLDTNILCPPSSPIHFIDDLLKESNNIDVENIREGQLFEGEYFIEQDAVLLLLKRFNLSDSSLKMITGILLWSSYFVGMVMPGQQALYSGLNFELDQYFMELATSIKYSVENKKMDKRFNLLNMEFNCFYPTGDKMVHGNLSAFVRPKINHNNSAITLVPVQDREKLRGKTALITGASRGLGSALAQVLAAMSCHVIVNFQYSFDDAVSLQKQISIDGTIELWQGDISDMNWLNSKKRELIERKQTIDILICNACQAPKEMIFAQNTVSRINVYIQKNLEITSVPLSLFTPMLNDNNGYGIIISSEYITKPVSLWPHYISLKAAIEGLISSISIQYNKMQWLIVRPPKLLTDMSNSPISNRDAKNPFLIAKSICEYIFSRKKPVNSESVEIFTPG
jgi:NAD(P)-dependent dehydrogenase (short-subunit alcohol dehydrogenase family)